MIEGAVRRCVAALALFATASCALRPTSEILSALDADGFDLVAQVEFQGVRGFKAASRVARTLKTGAPKLAYYVEGTGYQMGYLIGLMGEPAVADMTVDYVNLVLPSLLSDDLDYNMQRGRNALVERVYESLTVLLGDVVTSFAYESFERDRVAGVIPAELVQELHGVLDGCRAANPATKVTFERLATLNYGLDWVLAHIYPGKLPSLVLQRARQVAQLGGPLLDALNSLSLRRAPPDVFCDAFCMRGSATAPGAGPLYGRDFQMPTGRVFQLVNALLVFAPTDGRRAVVSSAAPGMVGSVTALNADGVAMGVDVMRSAAANSDRPGLNAILLVRHVAHVAGSTQEALDVIAGARRGVPYLYSLCDAASDGAIVEAGAHEAPSEPYDAVARYASAKVRNALPMDAVLSELARGDGARYLHGAWARSFDYAYPRAVLGYNDALFRATGAPEPQAGAFDPEGHFYQDWRQEASQEHTYESNYFAPPRDTGVARDGRAAAILVSNHALVPQMRVTQMSGVADALAASGHATQWRYDSLAAQLRSFAAGPGDESGGMDVAGAKQAVSFLSPDRAPGYWHHYLTNATQPMSAEIEGSMVVADLKARVLHSKSGYWADEWYAVSLAKYV